MLAKENEDKFKKPTVDVMMMRLLCCYLFHMTTYGDVVDSWQRLKFLKNNPQKFDSKNLMTALIINKFLDGKSNQNVAVIFIT